MWIFSLIAMLSACAAPALAETEAPKLWAELKAKREALPGLHQEFEVSRTTKSARSSQSSKSKLILDLAGAKWREKTVSGSGPGIRLFDGSEILRIEEAEGEYIRVKRKPKDPEPAPLPFGFGDPQWEKATELQRQPCGFRADDRPCAILQAPLKPWTRTNGNDRRTMKQGSIRVSLDLRTGAVVAANAGMFVDDGRGGYSIEITYAAKQLDVSPAANANLFALPPESREVKKFTEWNASRIRKQLSGKEAPEFAASDLTGSQLSLADHKGKIVLLDFWTTWCPPCRADAPALDKLHYKYGAKDLAIIGVSVSEERAIVEKFLKDHPHSFPVVLTSENDMPRAYQIGVFPTYIVIDRDGTVTSAVEGNQGFGELRKLLKKAGIDAE